MCEGAIRVAVLAAFEMVWVRLAEFSLVFLRMVELLDTIVSFFASVAVRTPVAHRCVFDVWAHDRSVHVERPATILEKVVIVQAPLWIVSRLIATLD